MRRSLIPYSVMAVNQDYRQIPKEVAICGNVTANCLAAGYGTSLLVSGSDDTSRDSLIEAWLQAFAYDTPIIYFHDGNILMASLFRQLFPESLMIGAYNTRGEYDPMRDIPIQRFFSELISCSEGASARVSLSYLKGVAALLVADHFEPTLYRLNCYANKDLGAVLRQVEGGMDDDTYELLNRSFNRTEQSIESTLDFLDIVCAACGSELNTGRMSAGKSIVSALRDGKAVSIDTRALENPMAAALVEAQLHIARENGIRYAVAVDSKGNMQDALRKMIMGSEARNLALFSCPNIWAMGHGDTGITDHILSNQRASIFFPSRNQAFCLNLSKHLDTYWRQNVTQVEGRMRGRNRRAFALLPVNSNGRNSAININYTREMLVSANELRELPRNIAVILSPAYEPIMLCPVIL